VPPGAHPPRGQGERASDRVIAASHRQPTQVDLCPMGTKTALMAAAAPARLPCVEALLEAGADPNISLDGTGTTAVMLAAEIGASMCVDMLLSHGARAALRDSQGKSALRMAVDAGTKGEAAAISLLRHGANAHGKAADGKTPLDVAKSFGLSRVLAKMESMDHIADRAEEYRLAHAAVTQAALEESTGLATDGDEEET
jgi:ankyrin repeat protein